MTYSYKTHGTCSRRIDFDLDDDNTVHNVRFTGGCTSCPDQFAEALREALEKKNSK